MVSDETRADAENTPDSIQVYREPLIKAGWLRCLLFVPALGVAATLIGLVALLLPGVSLETEPSGPVGDLAAVLSAGAMLVATLLTAFLFRKLIDRRSFVSLGFSLGRQMRIDLVAGMIWGVGLISAVFCILLSMGGVNVESIQFPPVGALIYLVLLFAVVAVSEELMIRGYLLNNLMASMNKYIALLLVSVIFAAFHGANPNVTLVGLLNIVLAGLLLGIYYVHRQNLWFPIGMHWTWNLFQGGVYGSSVSGTKSVGFLTLDVSGSELLTGGEFGFEASLVTSAVILAATILIHLRYRSCKSWSSTSPAEVSGL